MAKTKSQKISNLGGFYAFMADRYVRETFESIAVAILLALLFRTFMAENYIIPTGSMAPGLMGQHMDVYCEKCGLNYETSASPENPDTGGGRGVVTHTFCPLDNYRMMMRRNTNPDHKSNQGDRIAVNKYIYDFTEPQRFDVIVFKNPTNGKQNYIKRLGGLPGEGITIECGDLYVVTETQPGVFERQIIHKPEDKLRATLHLVDDTNHISPELHRAG